MGADHVAKEAAKQVKHATKELGAMDRARQTRAELAGLEERVAEVRTETQRSWDANVASK